MDSISQFWCSYGGGVNSTAMAILIVNGSIELKGDVFFLFSDTHDEKRETMAYIKDVFSPWLMSHGHKLHVASPNEGVLERCMRLNVINQRMVRRCTVEAKIRPIERFIKTYNSTHNITPSSIIQVIGIDAGEPHRARPAIPTDKFEKLYPLVELGIDRAGCEDVIRNEGLPIPSKSGCWHCPFMRVKEILALARNEPCQFAKIEELEKASNKAFPPNDGRPPRANWHDVPASEWRRRAMAGENVGDLFYNEDDIPCGCFDMADGHDSGEDA